MGSRGAQMLLDMIANPEAQTIAETVMQPELIVRESSGPAKAGK